MKGNVVLLTGHKYHCKMRIILLLALLSRVVLNAQHQSPPIESPPNGIYLKGNLYMDATEVSNINWLEYGFYIRQDSSTEYVAANMPSKEVTKNYRPEYYGHPKYRYYPVVGISYEQAMNYCKWRSDVVNLKLAKDSKRWRINYRLPTEKEWEMAAQSIDTLKFVRSEYDGPDFYFKDNRKLFRELFPDRDINFRQLKNEIRAYKKSKVPEFVIDYEKPWFILNEEKLPKSIYEHSISQSADEYQHLIGNVAEMVLEKGIVKGGSWRHILATSFPSKRQEINPTKVYDWVGLRCIGEVYKIEDNEYKKP